MRDRDNLIHMLLDYQMQVKDQEKRIMHLANAIYLSQDEEMVEKLVREFAVENEDIYLRLKRFVYDIRMNDSGNTHEMFGTTDSFPAALEKVGAGLWKFHLPPFYSVNIGDRGPSGAGKHMFYLVLNLEAEYEAKQEKIEKLKSPLIVFEHHICSNVQRTFDFDNIDSKRALDAIQGYFIDDDNALSVTVVNIAVADPAESYCDMYVAERSDLEIYKKIMQAGENIN